MRVVHIEYLKQYIMFILDRSGRQSGERRFGQDRANGKDVETWLAISPVHDWDKRVPSSKLCFLMLVVVELPVEDMVRCERWRSKIMKQ
jgi:hypothetical protein